MFTLLNHCGRVEFRQLSVQGIQGGLDDAMVDGAAQILLNSYCLQELRSFIEGFFVSHLFLTAYPLQESAGQKPPYLLRSLKNSSDC